MSETRMQSGTLQVLINKTRDDDYVDYAQPLSWRGHPPDASWQDDYFADVDLGDASCDPLPSLPPAERGLWLLTWEWEEVPDADWDGETTAKYAPTCEWRRPTMDDLIALGALPSARAATTEGGTTR